jgi:NAD(P)-dependent dehydrogenase (short-subunit alcohol dehydrogenase family)
MSTGFDCMQYGSRLLSSEEKDLIKKLAGKVALVTGGASGIGRASAVHLAREGATIVLADIQDGKGMSCAAQIAAASGTAIYVHLDVTDETSWIATVAQIARDHRRLDILVNNAGIGIGGEITELSLADWRRQQAVNLDGVFLGIKHCLPLMRAGGGGSIINMSSVTALVGSSTFVSYAAAKGGVRALTKSVARQCAALKDGVRVNSIHPGIIDTPIFQTLEGASGAARDPNALVAAIVPLGTIGQPEDIAAGVVYLAGDDSRYVTGTELVIDGGLVIH